MPPASRSARPARCSAPSSARSWCRRTSATAAATACRRARSASSTSARTTAACGSARSATTGCRAAQGPPRARRRRGREPACARACPTDSIQFGELDDLRERAHARVETLHEAGETSARLYLDDPDDGIGGAGAFFLLLDEPEVYGLPPDPVDPVRDIGPLWRTTLVAAGAVLAGAAAAVLGGRR